MHKLFFELIQVAISRRDSLSRVPSAEEWRALYGLAVKQAVVGVCFCGVSRLPKVQLVEMPVQLKLQWFALAERVKQRSVVMNQRCGELCRMLEKEGMRCAILKGQGVATLYYNSDSKGDGRNLELYRQSGDIDVWVDGGMEKVLSWCREKFGDVEYDYNHAHVPVFKDVEVELHWRVQSMTNLFRNRRLQRWLENEETKKMILGGKADLKQGTLNPETSITVPSLEFNVFYLMLHCYNHEFSSGLGIRQLMDYYFLLMYFSIAHRNINAIANANRLFKAFGMERFVGAVMWIMQEVFGLEHERLLCEPDKKEGRFILAEVMAGGNFGHHDERIKKVGKGKWRTVLANLQHAMQMLRRYPSEAFWMPVWMVYHFVWKRTLKIR